MNSQRNLCAEEKESKMDEEEKVFTSSSKTPSLENMLLAQLPKEILFQKNRLYLRHSGLTMWSHALKKNLSNPLLELVAQGRQEEAKNMLEEHSGMSVLNEGDVTDFSGRHFTNITPIQYAAWAYDIHMLKMLLTYLPYQEKLVAHEQLKHEAMLKAGGKHDTHYNYVLFLSILKNYFHMHDVDSIEQDTRKNYYFDELGMAQRNVPVHVANEYCRKESGFDPLPSFEEEHLPRRLEVYNFLDAKYHTWFPLTDKKGLGYDFAINRGYDTHHANMNMKTTFFSPRFTAKKDYFAMKKLFTVRVLQLAQLIDELAPANLLIDGITRSCP